MAALDSFIVQEDTALSLLHVTSMESKARKTRLLGSFDRVKVRVIIITQWCFHGVAKTHHRIIINIFNLFMF